MKKSNFKISEFICMCGKCRGITPNQIIDIEKIIIPVLEIIREENGNSPIYINSGVRCTAHNKRVKGARNSMHLDGLAVDIRTRHLSNMELFSYLLENKKRFKITELIKYQNFVHVGFRLPNFVRNRI